MTEISKINSIEPAQITNKRENCKNGTNEDLQLLFDEDVEGAIIPKTLLSELNSLNFRKEVIMKQIEELRRQENNDKAQADKIKEHIKELEESIKEVDKESSLLSNLKSFFTGEMTVDERIANLEDRLNVWKGKLYEVNMQAISNSASRAEKEQILKQIEAEIIELASNIKTYKTPQPGLNENEITNKQSMG